MFEAARYYFAKPKDNKPSARTDPQQDDKRQLPSEPIVSDCDLADLPDKRPHPSVAVLDFQTADGLSLDVGMALADMCRETMHESRRYILVDREHMKTLLTEEEFAATFECDDTQCLVDFGKKLRAQKMVHGRVGRIGNDYLLAIKLLDVGSARVDALKTARVFGEIENVADFIAPTTCELLHEALEREP